MAFIFIFGLIIYCAVLRSEVQAIALRLTQLSNRLSDVERGREVVASPAHDMHQVPASLPISHTSDTMPTMATSEYAGEHTAGDTSAVGSDISRSTSVESPQPSTEMVWATYLARAGVIAILFGVAFFLKLAIDNEWIGIIGRLVIGGVIGTAGVVGGYMLRASYRTYAHVIIGGGLSILYITIYAATNLYEVIEAPIALGLMVGITALSVIMSIVDKSPQVARMGVAGGFIVPFLIGGQVAQIFSYLFILNIGILATSLRYRWHDLHTGAFIGTLCVYMVRVLRFEDSARQTFLVFTVLFFLTFVGIAIAKHVYKKEVSTSEDISLLIGASTWYGIAVYALAYPISTGYTIAYMLLAASVLGASSLALFFRRSTDRALGGVLTGLAVMFASIIVPLYADGIWITYIWFMEAIILFLVDYMLRGRNLFGLGTFVYVVGIMHYVFFDKTVMVDINTFQPIFNERLLLLLITIATSAILARIAILTHLRLKNNSEKNAEHGITEEDISGLKTLSIIFFVLMNIFAVYTITTEIRYTYDRQVYEAKELHRSRVTQLGLSTDAFSSANEITDRQIQIDRIWDGYYKTETSILNQKDTLISVAWGIYAAILLLLGFMKQSMALRVAGLSLLFITLVKVFLNVWSLGGMYRIISSITIGVLALICSFVYAKYARTIGRTIIGS